LISVVKKLKKWRSKRRLFILF